MAQITNGIRSVLSHPIVYDSLQTFMGARRIRTEFVEKNICPKEGERILDIGCGTAELLAYLPDQIEYVGYDPSDNYIAYAKKRFGERGKFFVGYYDATEIAKHKLFDIVIASGVLHHIEDEHVVVMMNLAKKSLAKNGRFITIDPVYCEKQNPVAKCLIAMDRGQNVRNADHYCLLAKQSFSDVEGNIYHRKWIPYTHWVMECRI